MSRKLVYNINRFDGGITHDTRDTTDLSKCAHVSHFDIYRDPHRLYPMPGYIDDMNDGSTSTGMKQYNIAAFNWYDGLLWAVGTKSDGSGWKLFAKDDLTAGTWDTTPSGGTYEGTNTLYKGTYLTGDASNQYFVTTAGGKTYITENNGGALTDVEILSFAEAQPTLTGTRKMVAEIAPDANSYSTKIYQNVDLINITGASASSNTKTTAQRNMDIAPGDDQLGIFGYRKQSNQAQLLLWDTASTLVDANIEFGRGWGKALGNIEGTWVGIVDENLGVSSPTEFTEQANGKASFAVKAAGAGGGATTLTRVYGATSTNGKVEPNRGRYNSAMLFEARVPTNAGGTTFNGGIWAVGRATPNSPIALSQLLDTESLGSIQAYHTFGDHHYFAHAADGSISRLDNFSSGTYDVAAVYESLFFGADSPNHKKLNGISVHTENLPASGSVVAKYRTDDNDSWTTLATSSTSGTQIHNFTHPSGAMVGNFTEIQFRIEVTGNAPVKNIYISLEELNTTPYDA